MPSEFSFDIVSKVDMTEVTNAITQAQKELSQRFDFKGSKSEITQEVKDKKDLINVVGDDEMKLQQVMDIVESKLAKRNVSLKALEYAEPEAAFSGTVRRIITIKSGIETEKAKEITKFLRDAKFKAQCHIQDAQIRVTSKVKDELQGVMKAVRDHDFGIYLHFTNFR